MILKAVNPTRRQLEVFLGRHECRRLWHHFADAEMPLVKDEA
jgi:hypothetical protein